MKIIIQTPDFTATQKLKRFVTSRLEKLMHLHEGIMEARVCLKIENSDSSENKFCEIRLGVPGDDLFASRQTETFEESVVKTIEALKHQIGRQKTQQEKRRYANPSL